MKTTKTPRLDFMEQSIGGPVTTKEQRSVVDVIKRRLHKIKNRILRRDAK